MSNKLNELDLDKLAKAVAEARLDIEQAQVDRRHRVVEEGARLRTLGKFPPLGIDGWKLKK